MRQVLQEVDSGATRVREVPAPVCGPREVLIANRASLISAGTERAVIDLARKSLLGKARERPDQVRRVLEKLRREGVLSTLRQVREKLASPLSLGYSAAGVVLEVGAEVDRFRPGDRVASNGPHAEVVAVPQNLVARMPEGLGFPEACYASVGAIALQGVRLAGVGLGDRVAVIGLGIIGQLAVQLLRAAGCVVLGTDPDVARRDLAVGFGAEAAPADGFVDLVLARTDGHGVDAVLLTASTPSDEPLALAARVARRKARLVAVGAVGLAVPRREFYPKELELVVSCSYGPGRYDPAYEERGTDYPYAYVRWTEQRNLEAVLEQAAAGRLDLARLTSHTFPIAEAERAYELIESDAPSLGVVLTYPEGAAAPVRRVALASGTRRPHRGKEIGVAVVGAGNFSSLVLLPEIARLPGVRRRALCSAGGVSALVRGERHGFEVAATSYEEVLADREVEAVVIATRHHQHAAQLLGALRAGKHVFVEKPLAIDFEELEEFVDGLHGLGREEGGCPIWTVGFNRRFSRAARQVAEFFAGVEGPRTVVYRFAAGPVPADHWVRDPEVGGGRLVGEACHALDTVRFLVGSPIVRIHAEASPGGDDRAAMTLRCADGSVAAVSYFAGGDPAFPKERIEVQGGGRTAVIDDFARLELARGGKVKTVRLPRDKGHAAELAAFFEAVRRGGEPPIPYGELLNVSRAALAARTSIAIGLPVEVPPT
jgi:predicted dehydrogenase/threonine dehydrogenase-like Zn-dependent dehydrogenase